MGFFDDDDDHDNPFVGYHYEQHHSDVNRKIIYISALSFIILLFLLFALYLYCRCVLQRRSRHRAAIHRLTIAAIHVSDADADANTNAAHRRAPPLNAGLDPAITASLPTFTVGAKALDSATVECAVCLSALQGEEKAKLLPNCNHFFHVDCIDTWLKSHITCPLCRAEVKPRLEPQHREGVHGPVVPLALDDGESSSKSNDSVSRLSSFKRMLSRERSSTRILPSGHGDEVGGIDHDHDHDLERQ